MFLRGAMARSTCTKKIRAKVLKLSEVIELIEAISETGNHFSLSLILFEISRVKKRARAKAHDEIV